jgi:hypothetical protein
LGSDTLLLALLLLSIEVDVVEILEVLLVVKVVFKLGLVLVV